ncbi:MAG TPA: biotin--[acetyl-CoA-carboxylase] ligase [Candidatus Dormibacteraeota bacterium]|nr:biotin--[acetyl-CoA-carboxylase] ligase [Candidatus Dormibacteraeota bacterium]
MTAEAIAAGWLARLERYDVVGSTNDVVMGWLRDGTPEVCVAVADAQSAGRGRSGRSWTAPRGASLLLSAGFRPTWLAPEHTWRLGAIVSLAMAAAAEEVVAVPAGTVRLKWPNDLVIDDADAGPRKLAGVLGETDGLGSPSPKAVIGIGVNVDWARGDFPGDLAPTMTSLSELANGRPTGRATLADAFLARLEPLVERLRAGGFDGGAWTERQLTNDRPIRLEWPDGSVEHVAAVSVDSDTGALFTRALDGSGPVRPILVGEIRHLRVAGATRGV